VVRSTGGAPGHSGSSPVPSGLPNHHGAIPFIFPTASELGGFGALSDVLVCRRRHDRYAVITEKRLPPTGAEAEVGTYLEQWRRTAVNRVCKAFELVKEAEVERSRKKLYFYRKSHGLPPAEYDDDPDPVPDPNLDGNGEVRAHGFEEPEAEEMDVDVDKTGGTQVGEVNCSPPPPPARQHPIEWIYATLVSQFALGRDRDRSHSQGGPITGNSRGPRERYDSVKKKEGLHGLRQVRVYFNQLG
jgi:hypothetical protein